MMCDVRDRLLCAPILDTFKKHLKSVLCCLRSITTVFIYSICFTVVFILVLLVYSLGVSTFCIDWLIIDWLIDWSIDWFAVQFASELTYDVSVSIWFIVEQHAMKAALASCWRLSMWHSDSWQSSTHRLLHCCHGQECVELTLLLTDCGYQIANILRLQWHNFTSFA